MQTACQLEHWRAWVVVVDEIAALLDGSPKYHVRRGVTFNGFNDAVLWSELLVKAVRKQVLPASDLTQELVLILHKFESNAYSAAIINTVCKVHRASARLVLVLKTDRNLIQPKEKRAI